MEAVPDVQMSSPCPAPRTPGLLGGAATYAYPFSPQNAFDNPTPTTKLRPSLSNLTISTPTTTGNTVNSNLLLPPNSKDKSSSRKKERSLHFMSTPVASAKRLKRDDSQNSGGRINPFERSLLEKLHKPVWSPGVLKTNFINTPPQKHWAIDQISILHPTAIEESPSTHQTEVMYTPETESKVQEAIQKFFSQPPDMVSPTPSPKSKDDVDSGIEVSTAMGNNDTNSQPKPGDNPFVTPVKTSVTKAVNTDLSFPFTLPPEVEAILYAYTTDSSTSDSTAADTSITRRKLEFSFEVSNIGSDLDHNSPGQILPTGKTVHSPIQDSAYSATMHSPFNPASCSSRLGLISPNSTPIKYCDDHNE